jgi:hypothetical protein
MTSIKLENGFSFAIERHEKRARLIVYKDGVENVCRMESFKNIERFIRADEERIFKGRLQLSKNSEEIVIEVKGEIAGKMMTENFTGYLEKVKNLSDNSIHQK